MKICILKAPIDSLNQTCARMRNINHKQYIMLRPGRIIKVEEDSSLDANIICLPECVARDLGLRQAQSVEPLWPSNVPRQAYEIIISMEVRVDGQPVNADYLGDLKKSIVTDTSMVWHVGWKMCVTLQPGRHFQWQEMNTAQPIEVYMTVLCMQDQCHEFFLYNGVATPESKITIQDMKPRRPKRPVKKSPLQAAQRGTKLDTQVRSYVKACNKSKAREALSIVARQFVDYVEKVLKLDFVDAQLRLPMQFYDYKNNKWVPEDKLRTVIPDFLAVKATGEHVLLEMKTVCSKKYHQKTIAKVSPFHHEKIIRFSKTKTIPNTDYNRWQVHGAQCQKAFAEKHGCSLPMSYIVVAFMDFSRPIHYPIQDKFARLPVQNAWLKAKTGKSRKRKRL